MHPCDGERNLKEVTLRLKAYMGMKLKSFFQNMGSAK